LHDRGRPEDLAAARTALDEVVDDGVHERGAQLRVVVLIAELVRGGGPVLLALGAADVAPAAAVWDVAQLRDVDVQQCTGSVVFLAADRVAGDPVDTRQAIGPAAAQHVVRRSGRDPDPGGDLHRPQPLLPAQMHDPAHHGLRRPSRTAMRAAAAVSHARLTRLPVALGPPVGRRPRHHGRATRPGWWPEHQLRLGRLTGVEREATMTRPSTAPVDPPCADP
jgi:hypothetical protein